MPVPEMPSRNPKPAVRDQSRGEGMRPPEAEAKVDMAVIEAKVAQTIAPMSDGVPAVPAAPSPTRKLAMPGKEPDPTPEPGSVEPDPLVPVAEAGEKKADDGPPAIPENYIKAAKHLGVTEAEVAEMYEENPERAVRILKGYHETVNKTSQSFAALGRKQQEMNAVAAQKAAPAAPVVTDYSDLEEEYGEDSPILKAMKTRDAEIAELKAARAAEPPPQTSVDPVIMTTLDNFFGGDGMKPFQGYYGKVEAGDWRALDAGEFARREAVIAQAEQMVLGAQVQGEAMPLDIALGRAHLMVSEGMREQAIRAEIKSQIKAKANGVTLTPSSSGTGVPSGTNPDGTKTQAQLEADTTARLQRMSAGQKVRG